MTCEGGYGPDTGRRLRPRCWETPVPCERIQEHHQLQCTKETYLRGQWRLCSFSCAFLCAEYIKIKPHIKDLPLTGCWVETFEHETFFGNLLIKKKILIDPPQSSIWWDRKGGCLLTVPELTLRMIAWKIKEEERRQRHTKKHRCEGTSEIIQFNLSWLKRGLNKIV